MPPTWKADINNVVRRASLSVKAKDISVSDELCDELCELISNIKVKVFKSTSEINAMEVQEVLKETFITDTEGTSSDYMSNGSLWKIIFGYKFYFYSILSCK